jgi:hypothetical protein
MVVPSRSTVSSVPGFGPSVKSRSLDMTITAMRSPFGMLTLGLQVEGHIHETAGREWLTLGQRCVNLRIGPAEAPEIQTLFRPSFGPGGRV